MVGSIVNAAAIACSTDGNDAAIHGHGTVILDSASVGGTTTRDSAAVEMERAFV